MVRSDRIVAIAFSAATLLGVAACSDSTGAGIGTVNVRLTNASVAGPMAADVVTSGTESPIPDGYVKSVDIFVVRIDAKAKEPTDDEAAQATEESESSGEGWVTVRPDAAHQRDEHVPWRREGYRGVLQRLPPDHRSGEVERDAER